MYQSVERSAGRRPGRVPLAFAVTSGLVLGAIALPAALGVLLGVGGGGGGEVGAIGVVLRTLLAVVAGCGLIGAVLLALRRPAGRTLVAVGGAVASAIPVLMIPVIVVLPAELADGIRQAGGPLVPLALVVLGPLTMAQSLHRNTRDAIAAGDLRSSAGRW